MKKSVVISVVIAALLSAAFGIAAYRAYVKTPYTMAWDMAAHTYYAAELAQDIRHGHLFSFFNHINNSSIALWPFLHSVVLGLWFIPFGFSERAAVLLTVCFSSLCIMACFIASWFASGKKTVLPGLLVVFLLISSPLFIAFSTYVMLEIFGAFLAMTTVIFVCLSFSSDKKNIHTLAAVSFLLLFLTKINYGLYLFVPYLVFEFLNLKAEKRGEYFKIFLRFMDLKNVRSIWNILIFLNAAALIVMEFHSGFNFQAFGREIDASGTKNLVYLLLCLVFLKSIVFYVRNRGTIAGILLPMHLSIIRIVVLPLFVWFLINPGRISEFIRMSSDRTTDFGTIGIKNLIFYPKVFVTDYCCHTLAGIVLLLLFLISGMRWKGNPLAIRFLIILTLFGYLGLTLKLYNFAGSRFIFVQVPVVFIVATVEIWRIGEDLKKLGRVFSPLYYLMLILLLGLLAAFPVRSIYGSRITQIIRKSAPTLNPKYGRSIEKILKNINSNEQRICIIGGSNEISPFLVRWKLIKTKSDMIPDYINPPVKNLNSEIDREKFNSWLANKHADVIICIEIMDVSPFAQSRDFKAFHSGKQALVKYLYEKASFIELERWLLDEKNMPVFGRAINKSLPVTGEINYRLVQDCRMRLLDYARRQNAYYRLVAEAGWGNTAAGIKLYRPLDTHP